MSARPTGAGGGCPRESTSLFSPFSTGTGGLFWYDKQLHEETKKIMKKKAKLPPVTIIEVTYKMKE
jgi:microcin C transport system substrate-binding protein